MSDLPTSFAVLALALANRELSATRKLAYRPADQSDFRVGLPLYGRDQHELHLGSTPLPFARHRAAGTITSVRPGFVTFRSLEGKTELVSVEEACRRFWVCERSAASSSLAPGAQNIAAEAAR